MAGIKADWYCIINPHAGSGKTMSEWTKAEAALTQLSVPFKTSLTNYKFHAVTLAYEAALHGYRRLIAVGGDGSVHEILNGIMRYCTEYDCPPEDFYLAVIPIGSGNDWIKSNNVPHDTETVINLIALNSFAQQDLVKVETSEGVCYMANIGGVGFDSHVCNRVNRQKERGKRTKMIYFKALIHSIRWIRSFKGTVVADGKTVFEGDMYSFGMGNGKFCGGGMVQVPNADNRDGWLDYLIVPKGKLRVIIKELPRLFNNTMDQSPIMISGRCRMLELTADRNDIIEVDGEIEGNLPLTVSMTGSKINVLVGSVS